MIEKAKVLLAHAVERFGKADRYYKVMFCCSSPRVDVTDTEDEWVATLWMMGDEIRINKPKD